MINKCREYFDCLLAHTGQNYDYNLNGVFFKDLKLADTGLPKERTYVTGSPMAEVLQNNLSLMAA